MKTRPQSTPSHNLTFAAICFAALMMLNGGCASRVILVPHGEPVRLAEPVKAKVFVPDNTGKIVTSQNRVTIPAGWYALPK